MIVFAAALTVSGFCPREPVTVGIAPSFSFVLPSLSLSDGVATRVHAPPFFTRYVTRVFKTGAVPPKK
jgi:hypothetical protein